MNLLVICTWTPEDDREVRTRGANWEWPPEVKVYFELYDLQGCRTIYAIDTDEKGLIAMRAKWSDILEFEIFPVFPIGATKDVFGKG